MPDEKHAAELLKRYFESDQAELEYAPATSAEIRAAEQRLGVSFPLEFAEYIRTAAPVKDADLDYETTAWYSLRRLETVKEGVKRGSINFRDYESDLVLFADYCIWFWGWAINCAPGEDNGKVALLLGSDQDRWVANSFSEFVRMYLDDPMSVC